MASPAPQSRVRSARLAAARFLTARGGATAIEFAFLSPILILLLFATIEFSLIMLVNNMMEGATNISSRLGKTGFVASGQSRQDTILAAVRTRTGTLIDADKLTLSARIYPRFAQIGQPEPWTDHNGNGIPDPGEYDDINGNGAYDTDMGRAGYGNAGDIVVYTVTYPWEIMTPIMRELIGDEHGIFAISTNAVVKNEPYEN